jgi:hypothetical protein
MVEAGSRHFNRRSSLLDFFCASRADVMNYMRFIERAEALAQRRLPTLSARLSRMRRANDGREGQSGSAGWIGD